MRKFLIKVLIFGIYVAVLTVWIPVIADPYNIFHAEAIRDNGVEPNKNYVKMHYILDNPDKFDAFLFGSSLVGAIHTDNIAGEKCYNMTYSRGVPTEYLANLQTLISNGVVPHHVYLGIDHLAYTEDYMDHYNQPMRCPYEYSQSDPAGFLLLYLNTRQACESIFTSIKHNAREGFVDDFYEYGWWCDYDRKNIVDWTKAKPYILQGNYSDKALQDINEIVVLCRKNNIELTVFTNPEHEATYRASCVENDYPEFLERLTEVTSFYNFSGINEVTLNGENYVDATHYNAYVGDMIIECICSGKTYEGLYEQGFGMYVTDENIKELLAIIN